MFNERGGIRYRTTCYKVTEHSRNAIQGSRINSVVSPVDDKHPLMVKVSRRQKVK